MILSKRPKRKSLNTRSSERCLVSWGRSQLDSSLNSRCAKRAAGSFEQTLDKVLRNEAGQTTELDYSEQSSWMQ
jgi:hypothetical protein